MNEYLLILLWMGIMALFFRYVQTEKTMNVMGKSERRTAFWAALLVVMPLILMVGLRGNIGDTAVYKHQYSLIPTGFSEMLAYAADVNKDKGFWYLTGFIKVITQGDYTVYFFILGIFQSLALVKLYRRYSINFVLSVFLFIASCDYISWMYNGVRQFTAVAIIVYAFSLLMEKKYIPYFLVILLASTIHRSALLMIPIVFIVQGEAWNRRTIILLVISLLIVAYVDAFTDILDTMLEETQYENVVSDWKAFNDDGTNPIRVLVYSVPAIISFMGLKHIRYENDPVINVCTNMSIVASGLYIVSMATSGIFIGRLPIYASLYSYILLPWEIEHIFSRKTRPYIYIALIILYLGYYYYQMYISWSFIK